MICLIIAIPIAGCPDTIVNLIPPRVELVHKKLEVIEKYNGGVDSGLFLQAFFWQR